MLQARGNSCCRDLLLELASSLTNECVRKNCYGNSRGWEQGLGPRRGLTGVSVSWPVPLSVNTCTARGKQNDSGWGMGKALGEIGGGVPNRVF